MKAISFLGAGNASETTYFLPDGREYTAPYFPAALTRLYTIDTLLVFVTAGARDKHYDSLYRLTKDSVRLIEPIDIPDGSNETELWQIFGTVADAVEEKDEVIFDITHGFRTLPFLSFLAAAYLRAVKQIKLEAVVYGAFEAGDKSFTPTRAPVFDLTRFVTLLDWLTAADRFIRFGDANDLADLLKSSEAIPIHLAAATGNRQAQSFRSKLTTAAGAMEKVAQPLRLTRPIETMQAATALNKKLDAAQLAFEQWAPPFTLITDAVRQAYAPLALDKPLDQSNIIQSLTIQRDLIKWYVKKDQIIQAATLGQEWLISWTMVQMGQFSLDDRQEREQISRMLGRGGEWRRRDPEPFEEIDTVFLNEISQAATAIDLFHKLSQIRNDLNHAGFRKNALAAGRLVSLTKDLCAQLEQLSLPAKL